VEKTGTVNSTPGSQGLFRVDQIRVEAAAAPANAVLTCDGGGTACLPSGVTTLEGLESYIRGAGCTSADSTGTDGWYRNFELARERNVGQATVLGGLLTYTTYQPYDDICKPEGLGYLYGLYYTTGTAWSRPVFTNESAGITGVDATDNTVIETVELGRGLAKTPNLHVGRREGVKAFVQTSTGAIMEIPQANLPLGNSKSGRVNWREVTQ
jgi:type IV pilus assembly protein PilY1